MFSSSRSFILTVLSLSAAFGAAPAPARAAPYGNQPPHGITHSHINRANRTTFTLAPRAFENSRFTFYDAGQNACGSFDDSNAFVSGFAYLEVVRWYSPEWLRLQIMALSPSVRSDAPRLRSSRDSGADGIFCISSSTTASTASRMS